MNGKKILVTGLIVIGLFTIVVLSWGYFTRDANSVAIGTIGGVAGAIVGGGYIGRKRNEQTDSLDATRDAVMVRDSIERTKDVISESHEVASGLGDVADKLNNRARESGSIADRVREQIQKNKMGT